MRTTDRPTGGDVETGGPTTPAPRATWPEDRQGRSGAATRRAVTRAGALLAGAALAACGTTQSNPAPAGGRSKAPFTLQVIQSFPVPETEQYFKETFLRQYQDRVGGHADINFVWVAWNKMEDHFGVHKVAGTLEDVIRTGAGPWVWIYAQKQIGLPIDDRVKQWGKKEDFYPAAWETLVWEGKTYGLITHSGPRMYLYRKDIADEVGVQIADTWTWDNYLEAAQRLNRVQDGRVVRLGAWPVTLNWQEFMLMFYAAGGRVTRGGKAAFNTPEGEWALDLAVQRRVRLQPDGVEGLPATPGSTPFAAGSAAIVYGNMSRARDVERFAADQIKNVVVPLPPQRAKRVSMVNSDGLTINRDTKHPDEAWELLKLWSEPAAMEAWCSGAYSIPPRKSVAASAAFMQKPYLQKASSNLERHGVPVPIWPDYTNLGNLLQAELDAAMARTKSPREALNEAARAWNVVLEQNRWKD